MKLSKSEMILVDALICDFLKNKEIAKTQINEKGREKLQKLRDRMFEELFGIKLHHPKNSCLAPK